MRGRWAAIAGMALLVSVPGVAPAAASEIVYVCGKDLCRTDERGRERQRLTRDGGRRSSAYRRPSVSRNGRRLAFLRGDPGRLFTSDARVRRVTRIEAAPDGPRDATQFDAELRPDGRRVAWVESRVNVVLGGTDYRRYAAPFGGGRTTQVASNGGRPFVGWTNGQRIIREGDPLGGPVDRGLCVPAPETATNGVCQGPLSVLARDPARTLRGPVVSPKGRLLAVTASPGSDGMAIATEPPGAIALFDYGTGRLVRNLTRGPRDSHATFSPDGRFVAFQRRRSIYRVSVMGGRPKRIVRRGTQPTWGR